MFRTVFYTTLACLAVFTLIAISPGCKKEKADKVTPAGAGSDFDISRIWDCHNNSNPFPSQINKNLEGTWVWISSSCYWNYSEVIAADKQVVLIFKDAGNYQLFENGTVESEGTWKLSQIDNNTWDIVTSAKSKYLHGHILLCNDEVVFYSSYLDGCDYYFRRN
ncbi:MAG: hypothetical protein KDC07_04100 [Chitinophagaceae bacterium]|nr:hypothetical protein [Chitinophagaceae bacterium]MCB9047143.1 hypothetical protein [Chitinophagales bacterium]